MSVKTAFIETADGYVPCDEMITLLTIYGLRAKRMKNSPFKFHMLQPHTLRNGDKTVSYGYIVGTFEWSTPMEHMLVWVIGYNRNRDMVRSTLTRGAWDPHEIR